jgi:hypothetical protein
MKTNALQTMPTLKAALVSVSLLVATGAVAAQNKAGSENFRFAVPDQYSVIDHTVNPALEGGSVLFAPSSNVEATDYLMRLQTYQTEYMPPVLTAFDRSQSRELMNTILTTQLEAECSSHTLDSGKIRERNGEIRINWWTRCEKRDQPGLFEFERGRMFWNQAGAYFISHVNISDNKDHQFNRKEISWFDKYLINSGSCTSGKDCGAEGGLIGDLFKEK